MHKQDKNTIDTEKYGAIEVIKWKNRKKYISLNKTVNDVNGDEYLILMGDGDFHAAKLPQ